MRRATPEPEAASTTTAGEAGALSHLEGQAPRAVPLSTAGVDDVRFDKDGLVPAILQDVHSLEVLMLGFMNREMLLKTLETGDAWFWSRSRGQPWHKGETSGNFIRIREARRNCEDNSLLMLAEPVGPVCHTGEQVCYYRALDGAAVSDPAGNETPVGGSVAAGCDVAAATSQPESRASAESPYDRAGGLDWLFQIIEQRRGESPDSSYTARLLSQGVDRIGKKIGEEAAEVIIAAKNRSSEELANEMADLWYHALVLLADAGMSPQSVYDVLAQRHQSRTSPPASR